MASYPHPLADAPLTAELTEGLLHYAFTHGLIMVPKDAPRPALPSVAHLPFTALPSPVPRAAFEQARGVAADFNLLAHRISRDSAFLIEQLEPVGAVDAFTGRVLQLYKASLAAPAQQTTALQLNRSDYMLHAPEGGSAAARLTQVELNAISSSFGAMSTQISGLHRSFLERGLYGGGDAAALPANETLQGICASLAAAWTKFGKPGAVVLMLVQSTERNISDQRWLEYELWDTHRIKLERRTMRQMGAVLGAAESAPGAPLLLEGGEEVAVAYFRAGYTPDDYEEEGSWEGRRVIELSAAIKCPTCAYQLVGTKKMQQLFSTDEVLTRFMPEAEPLARLRACFTGLYSLSEVEEQPALVAKVLASPHDYVLKPQREGGGNNLYGDEMVAALNSMTADELTSFILMDRIVPPTFSTAIMRDGVLHEGVEGVYEMGVFAALLSDGDDVALNVACGQLLRTKSSLVEDGGVAAGVAVLDSPYLVD